MKTAVSIVLLICVTSFIQAQNVFQVGDDVRVNWLEKGTYYKGVVAEIKDSLYFIKYDDGDTEWAKLSQMKSDEFQWPQNNCKDKTSKFKVNDRVDVEENGTWYDATVLKEKDGQYYIHYDGWSSTYDVVVNNDRIRPFTKKAMTTSQENLGGTGGSSGSSSSNESTSVTIEIQNTCLKDVTMLIGDKEYSIARNSSLTLDVEVGTFVYGISGTKKVLKGTVSVNDYMNNFYPVCD